MESPRATIRLCGGLAVEVDGERLESGLPGRKGRLALAYLITNRDRCVRRDELIEVLWPERPPRDPEAALSALLSKLRAALGAAHLEGRGELRLLLPEPAWIDLEAARVALEDAQAALSAADFGRARERAKLVLYTTGQGLLPGLEGDWIDERRRELEEKKMRALESIARAGPALGGAAERAEGERAARELVADEPYRESGHRLLMEALAASGNVAEALRVYDELRVRLREELGATPGTSLQELHQRLLREGEAPTSPAPPGEESLPLQAALAGTGAAPFVGRREPLERLLERLGAARQGRMQLAFVSGEPGIGKSRLATELASAAHAEGANVLYGRSYQEGLFPYQPFVEALEHYAAVCPPLELRAQLGAASGELKRVLPGLGERVAALPEPEPAEPETERYRLLTAATSLIQAAAGARVLVLILDDLHWADDSTLLLLKHLYRVSAAAPLLILGTYRDSELGEAHPLLDALAELRRERPFEHLMLGGLADEEVVELIDALAGARSDRRLAQIVAARTEGNPFFVEELIRHLSESEVLERRDGEVVAGPRSEEIGVPEGVKQVIGSRLARLGEETNRVLPVAAAVGQEFGFDVLERVADVPGDALVEALEEAAAARLISEKPSAFGAYWFSHALVRETLYEQLSAPRRVRLHRRIAETLESINEPLSFEADATLPAGAPRERDSRGVGSPGEEAGPAVNSAVVLSHHWYEAGDSERAVHYLLAAAERANRGWAKLEAVSLFEEALALLPESDEERRRSIRLRRAVAVQGLYYAPVVRFQRETGASPRPD